MKSWHNVSIDGLKQHRAYLDLTEEWNGWARPWFERDEVFGMNEWLRDIEEQRISYDADTDTFVVTEYDEEVERYHGVDIDGMHLYPIGNGIWIWSIEEE